MNGIGINNFFHVRSYYFVDELCLPGKQAITNYRSPERSEWRWKMRNDK